MKVTLEMDYYCVFSVNTEYICLVLALLMKYISFLCYGFILERKNTFDFAGRSNDKKLLAI